MTRVGFQLQVRPELLDEMTDELQMELEAG